MRRYVVAGVIEEFAGLILSLLGRQPGGQVLGCAGTQPDDAQGRELLSAGAQVGLDGVGVLASGSSEQSTQPLVVRRDGRCDDSE